jgi:glycerophosphoryl diester phosphodiesterase
MLLSDLAALNVGGIRPGTGYAHRFSGQQGEADARIPTLAQVARLLREPDARHLRLNVETKTEPMAPDLTPEPESFASAVVKVLRDEGVADRASIQSFDWSVLTHVQRIAPETPTGYLSAQRPRENTVAGGNGAASPWTDGLRLEDFDGSVPDMVHAAGGRVWVPHYQDLSQGLLARARDLGLKVLVWTVNSHRDIRRLIRMGVDGIISDYPDRVREAAGGLNLALPPQVPAASRSG